MYICKQSEDPKKYNTLHTNLCKQKRKGLKVNNPYKLLINCPIPIGFLIGSLAFHGGGGSLVLLVKFHPQEILFKK